MIDDGAAYEDSIQPRPKKHVDDRTRAWESDADTEPGEWFAGAFDGACDCEFPWVRENSNPYQGKIERYRWCCLLTEMKKLWPHLFETVDAYYDRNTKTTHTEPMPWSKDDLPLPTFMAERIARNTGKPLEQVVEDADKTLAKKSPND